MVTAAPIPAGGSQAEKCDGFFYLDTLASRVYTYANDAAALVSCISCANTEHVSIAASDSATKGTCRLVNTI